MSVRQYPINIIKEFDEISNLPVLVPDLHLKSYWLWSKINASKSITLHYENGPRTKTAPGRKRPQDKNGPWTKTALASICYIVNMLYSKQIIWDVKK